MNFDEALVAHAEWKLKLMMHLQGEAHYEAASVCKDNQCKLGKWIYSDGKKFQNESIYEKLRERHAAFHRAAAEVIQVADGGRTDKARAMIADGSDYAKISSEVIESIGHIKRRVEAKVERLMEEVPLGLNFRQLFLRFSKT